MQWALAAQREPLGEAASAARGRRASWARAAVLPDGRRIGNGFRDALWPDAPTLAVLDAATGEVPTYLINADVHSVWLNSAALRREGFEPDGIGILREEPAFEISRRLNAVDAAVSDPLVAAMAQDAASRGVVGLVDLDMAWNEDAWARRLAAGFDILRVEFGIYPQSPRPRDRRGTALRRSGARRGIRPRRASGRSRSSPTDRSARARPRARTPTRAIRTTTGCSPSIPPRSSTS